MYSADLLALEHARLVGVVDSKDEIKLLRRIALLHHRHEAHKPASTRGEGAMLAESMEVIKPYPRDVGSYHALIEVDVTVA